MRLSCPLGNSLIFTWADKTTDNVTDPLQQHLKIVCHMLAMPVTILSLFVLLGRESAFEWMNVVHVHFAVKSTQQQPGMQWRETAYSYIIKVIISVVWPSFVLQ